MPPRGALTGPCEPHEVQQVQVKVLHMGQGTPQHQSRPEDEWIESSPVEEELGVSLGEKGMKKQRVLQNLL